MHDLVKRALAGEDIDEADVDRAEIIADAKRRKAEAEQQTAPSPEAERAALFGVSRIAAALAARRG
ncbi:hypothetical protein [Azospirillum sp. Marseille-Q6669]